MAVKISIKNTENVINFLNKAKLNIDKNTDEGVRKASLMMKNAVMSSISGHEAEPTSVDTGLFLNSVHIDASGKQAKIYSDLEYAKFLEYGTSKMNSRHHFRNSAFRKTGEVMKLVNDEVKISLK